MVDMLMGRRHTIPTGASLTMYGERGREGQWFRHRKQWEGGRTTLQKQNEGLTKNKVI